MLHAILEVQVIYIFFLLLYNRSVTDPVKYCLLSCRIISGIVTILIQWHTEFSSEFIFMSYISLENVIGMCVADKAEVINEDENDNGRRQILNYGHTAGHVIERDSGFTKPHGICVAKGMGIFMDACVKEGTLSVEDAKKMKDLLAVYNLPSSDEITPEDIVKGAMNDKKKRGNTLSVILVNKIGRAEIKKMTAEEFLKFLSV